MNIFSIFFLIISLLSITFAHWWEETLAVTVTEENFKTIVG